MEPLAGLKDLRQSLQEAKKRLEHHKKHGQWRDVARVHRRIASLLQQIEVRKSAKNSLLGPVQPQEKRSERIKEACKHAKNALGIGKKIDDKKEQAKSYLVLGQLQLLTGKCSKAIQNIQESIALFEQVGDIKRKGVALVSLGEGYGRTKRLKKAARTYKKAKSLFKEIGAQRKEVIASINIAFAFMRMPESEKARHYFRKTLQLLRQFDISFRPSLALRIAEMCFGSQFFDVAILFGKRALTQFRRVKDREGEAGAHYTLSKSFYEKGELEKALTHLQHSINLNKEYGTPKDVAVNYEGLAATYEKQGEDGKALISLLEAVRYYRETEWVPWRLHDQIQQQVQAIDDPEQCIAKVLEDQEIKDAPRLFEPLLKLHQFKYSTRLRVYKTIWKHTNNTELLDMAKLDSSENIRRWASQVTRKRELRSFINKLQEAIQKRDRDQVKAMLEEKVQEEVNYWLQEGHVNFYKSAKEDIYRAEGWLQKLFLRHMDIITDPLPIKETKLKGIFREILELMVEKERLVKKGKKYKGVTQKWPSRAPKKLVEDLTAHIVQKLQEELV